METRIRRSFTQEFKEQVVKLYLAGKPRNEIIKEYDLTPPAFDKWIRQQRETGSFQEKDNRTPEEEELLRLRNQNKQLAMENDICPKG